MYANGFVIVAVRGAWFALFSFVLFMADPLVALGSRCMEWKPRLSGRPAGKLGTLFPLLNLFWPREISLVLYRCSVTDRSGDFPIGKSVTVISNSAWWLARLVGWWVTGLFDRRSHPVTVSSVGGSPIATPFWAISSTVQHFRPFMAMMSWQLAHG